MTDGDRRGVRIEPSERRVRAAFNTQLVQYRDSAGRLIYLNSQPASVPSNLGSAHQVFRLGVIGIRHLVILMKRRHVPWNVGRNAHQKFRKPAQLVIGVVEAWDE